MLLSRLRRPRCLRWRRVCPIGRRPFTSSSSSSSSSFSESLLSDEKRVWLSSSRDVFTNLSAEDWLYRNYGGDGLLLLWRNDPCVVIGRHQNPWLECSLAAMRGRGVALARRNSGGGSVYHDLGNLNCTFFGRRATHDRKANLRIVKTAINERWPALGITLSPRDDILLDGIYKISGTAAKLGHKNAYHHCTVLFDVDKRLLTSVLKRRDETDGLESKATESVASPVKNLGEADPSVRFEPLIEAIGNGFRKQFGIDPSSSEIPLLNPSEETLPGLSDIEKQFRSWDWIFGRSPRFSLRKRCLLPPEMRHRTHLGTVHLNLTVFRGIVEELSFEPSEWMSGSTAAALGLIVGTRFPIGRPLAIEDDRWNENHPCETEEKLFIQETITRCTSVLT